MTVFCDSCGAQLRAQAKFCASCGEAVAGAPPASAPVSSTETTPDAGQSGAWWSGGARASEGAPAPVPVQPFGGQQAATSGVARVPVEPLELCAAIAAFVLGNLALAMTIAVTAATGEANARVIRAFAVLPWTAAFVAAGVLVLTSPRLRTMAVAGIATASAAVVLHLVATRSEVIDFASGLAPLRALSILVALAGAGTAGTAVGLGTRIRVASKVDPLIAGLAGGGAFLALVGLMSDWNWVVLGTIGFSSGRSGLATLALVLLLALVVAGFLAPAILRPSLAAIGAAFGVGAVLLAPILSAAFAALLVEYTDPTLGLFLAVVGLALGMIAAVLALLRPSP